MLLRLSVSGRDVIDLIESTVYLAARRRSSWHRLIHLLIGVTASTSSTTNFVRGEWTDVAASAHIRGVLLVLAISLRRVLRRAVLVLFVVHSEKRLQLISGGVVRD